MAMTPFLRTAALGLCLFTGAATAQEAAPASAPTATPAQLEAARAAIAAINTTDQFDEILMNAATQVKGELIANNPDRQTELSDMVDEAAIALAPRRADLENEVARIYARLFTEEELRAIAEFYESGAGQKLIQQGPAATRETVQAADIWANGIVRDLQSAAQAGARELVPAAEQPATPPAQ